MIHVHTSKSKKRLTGRPVASKRATNERLAEEKWKALQDEHNKKVSPGFAVTFKKCPRCGIRLKVFVKNLGLYQCPKDSEVYEIAEELT